MRIVYKFWDFERWYYLVDGGMIFENLTTPHYLNDDYPEFEIIDPDLELEYMQILATNPEQFEYELGSEDDFYHMRFRINTP